MNDLIVLDFETTGLDAAQDEVLQVSMVNGEGTVLMNEYCAPERVTKWGAAQKINGITADMVARKPPFRTLLPQEKRGLLVAGSCFSATHDAHASCRSMAQTLAMGQAAGTAAALAVAGDRLPHELEIGDLQTRLLAMGANVLHAGRAGRRRSLACRQYSTVFTAPQTLPAPSRPGCAHGNLPDGRSPAPWPA